MPIAKLFRRSSGAYIPEPVIPSCGSRFSLRCPQALVLDGLSSKIVTWDFVIEPPAGFSMIIPGGPTVRFDLQLDQALLPSDGPTIPYVTVRNLNSFKVTVPRYSPLAFLVLWV